MQSILQYRRLGVAAHAQLDRDAEKASNSSSQQQQPNVSSGTSEEEKVNGTQSPRSLQDLRTTDGVLGGASPSGNIQRSHTNSTAHSRNPEGDEEALGPVLTGIDVRNRTGDGGQVFVVGWAGANDPLMPHNWPLSRRVGVTLQISVIGLFLTGASGIDAAVLPQAAEDLGVSHVAESLATGK